MSPKREHAKVCWRNARFCVEAFTSEDYPTPKDWVAAIDEGLTDLARSFGVEPPRSLVAVLEDLERAS